MYLTEGILRQIIKNSIKRFIKIISTKNNAEYDFRPKPRKREILEIAMLATKSWRLPKGDYLEFGVWEGKSFVYAYNLVKRYSLDMKLYAFDSFKGLPAITDEDARTGIFKEGDYFCSEEQFRKNLELANVDLDKVTIVSGFYDQTLTPAMLTKLSIKRASVVFIDCDLYQSALSALDSITDIITNGTILIFDDWFCYGGDPMAGEIRATNEWLARNPQLNLLQYRKFGIDGNSFIVNVSE
jgi:hypothetical protein|tara:strand:- start:387 stop:1109 length:723 start_codon:yes stop_codon:yes gene_type:complete